MKVIGTGLGRTGTNSLKVALEMLGFGPCYHMDQVLEDMPGRVPLWSAALEGAPDWDAIYKGYNSAVDWPTCRFYKELYAVYPAAKFVHTVRSPESWAASFSETIYTAIAGRDKAPPPVQAWLDMATEVMVQTGIPTGLNKPALMERFEAHTEAVKAAIPADQLLVFEVKQGWAPLCAFLDVPVPEQAYPRTNNREEFWELISGGK